MKKRFLWSIVICLTVSIFLVPLNLRLIDNALNKNDLNATRQLNFFSLMFLEQLLIFNLAFNIVNTYYSVHTGSNFHKNIPDKYLKGTDEDG